MVAERFGIGDAHEVADGLELFVVELDQVRGVAAGVEGGGVVEVLAVGGPQVDVEKLDGSGCRGEEGVDRSAGGGVALREAAEGHRGAVPREGGGVGLEFQLVPGRVGGDMEGVSAVVVLLDADLAGGRVGGGLDKVVGQPGPVQLVAQTLAQVVAAHAGDHGSAAAAGREQAVGLDRDVQRRAAQPGAGLKEVKQRFAQPHHAGGRGQGGVRSGGWFHGRVPGCGAGRGSGDRADQSSASGSSCRRRA